MPKGSTHYSMTSTKTLENQQPFPVSQYADFPLSDAGLGDFAKLDATETKLSAWFGGQQITAYTDIEVSPEGKSALSDMYYLNVSGASPVWVNS